MGFKYILDGLNAERTLIAAECIGDGYWFIDRATKYANERIVFDRPIGKNQGVQFPIAEAYIEIEAANLMRFKACELFDANKPSGAQANMAKYLAAKASWEAANVCMQTHGGFGFANEYDIERKFRETRLYQVAPYLDQSHLCVHRRARARASADRSDEPRRLDRTHGDGHRHGDAHTLRGALGDARSRCATPPPGTPLPPLWHWLYFLPLHRRSELGPDGHAKKGGFLPPTPLPRACGPEVNSSSARRSHRGLDHPGLDDRNVSEKSGRTGPLIFVKVRHDIRRGERDGSRARRVPRHRVSRGAEDPATSRRPLPRLPLPSRGSASGCRTTCCCSAIRRSRSTGIAFTTTGATSRRSRVIPALSCTAAAGDADARSPAPRATRCGRRAVCLQGDAAGVRHSFVPRVRATATRRHDDRFVGHGPRGALAMSATAEIR
jgi:hypothetical protein